MKKLFFSILLLQFAMTGNSQTAEDLFKPGETKVYWLGVDFSHVKLIGDFSQFSEAGKKSALQVRDLFFPKWNYLIMSEPDKYDVKGMLRKGNMEYDIEMVMRLNEKAPVENMESFNVPNYTIDNIKDFIKEYNFQDKNGIGIVFIAECLNKTAVEAIFHFVAINMKTNEILIHERLLGLPRGIGLRNYWAGAIYNSIKNIKNDYYYRWKSKYKTQ